jgi:hypothetical protein
LFGETLLKKSIKFEFNLSKERAIAEQHESTLKTANNFILDRKGKVKLSLCLTKHHAKKMYWGVEVQLHAFLISALDGGGWSVSRLSRFTSRESVPDIH